jgi:hypothetical protein
MDSQPEAIQTVKKTITQQSQKHLAIGRWLPEKICKFAPQKLTP